MSVIWKIPLAITDRQEVVVPRGAVPLSVQLQQSDLVAWVLVDPDAPGTHHPVWIIGTGNQIDPSVDLSAYLGTVQRGWGVWHVFWSWDPAESAEVDPAVRAAMTAAAAVAAAVEVAPELGGWDPDLDPRAVGS